MSQVPEGHAGKNKRKNLHEIDSFNLRFYERLSKQPASVYTRDMLKAEHKSKMELKARISKSKRALPGV